MTALKSLSLFLAPAFLFGATVVHEVRVDRNTAGDITLDIVIEPSPTSLSRNQVHLRNGATGVELRIASLEYDGSTAHLVLASTEQLEEKDQILINIDPVQIAGKTQNVDPFLYIVKQTTKGSTPKRLAKADAKDDARFYFDGQISRARSQDVVGTYDLKFAPLKRAIILDRIAQYGALYTLTGGNDPKGDPDSMQIGWTPHPPVPFWRSCGRTPRKSSLRATSRTRTSSTRLA